MGIRIAKLENESTWVVYSSTTGVMFEPMFGDELSAELYAHHYYSLRDHTSKDWLEENRVGDEVMAFIRELLGDDPEANEKYSDILCAVQSVGNTTDELHDSFLSWRKDRTSWARFELKKEEEV